MTTLDLLVRQQLRRRDCVIVPGLGAFIAAYTPACYDSATTTFLPPERRLTFNAEVAHNDATLATALMRIEGVDFEGAMAIIGRWVDVIKTALENGETVGLDRIGTLRRPSRAAAPEFHPAADNVANEPYAFLPKLNNVVSVAQAKTEEAAEPTSTATFIDAGIETHPKRRWRLGAIVRVAASVAIVVSLGLTALTLLPDGPTPDTRDTAATMTASPAKQRPASFATGRMGDARELCIAIPQEETNSEVAPAEPTISPTKQSAAHNYYIVVASLPSRRLARKHIAYVGDSSLEILESEGRFRVYCATASTEEEAMAARDKARSTYRDAWVCAN